MSNQRQIILVSIATLVAMTAIACGATPPAATPTPENTPSPTATPSPENTPQTAAFTPWTRPSDKMVMVYVPEGPFTMGSDDSGYSDETPAHPVFLDAFWIDQTEVTNKMYALCVAAGKCDPPKFKSSYTLVSANWSE